MFFGHLVQLVVDDIEIGTLGKEVNILGTNKCAGQLAFRHLQQLGWGM